ncbi:MAG: hypothetical protein ACI4RO_04075 [Candidatus Scatosoma sp.]
MRIKRLKVNDVSGIENFNVEFSDTDNIICIAEKYKDGDNLPFGNRVLDVFEGLFFNCCETSYIFGYGEIQCLCEKYGKDFLILLQGKSKLSEIVYQGKKMIGQKHGVEETCFFDEEINKDMRWMARMDYREFLYPRDMHDYCKSNGFLDSAMEEVADSIDSEFSDSGRLTEEEWKLLKKRKRKYLAESEGIPFIEGQPLTINRKGELMFQDRYDILSDEAEKYFGKDEYARIKFLYWLATLNLIRLLCADIGRDGNLPIFIVDFFEKSDKEKDNSFLFEELRKTGRQAFIILHKRDEEIEKYCDKTIEIGTGI